MIGNGTHRWISLDLLGAIAGALSRSKNAPNTLENVRRLIELDGELERRVDGVWAQFCAGIGDSPDAPYPGMISAFESHYGQSFADKDWRNEASVWAAAWKSAKAHTAEQSKPVKYQTWITEAVAPKGATIGE